MPLYYLFLRAPLHHTLVAASLSMSLQNLRRFELTILVLVHHTKPVTSFIITSFLIHCFLSLLFVPFISCCTFSVHRNCCLVSPYCIADPFHCVLALLHYSFLAAPFRSCPVADPIHCALVVFLYSILGCTIPYLDCCSIPFCPSPVAAQFPCVVAVSILGCTITLCSCCTIPFSTCSVPSCLHHYISGLLLHTIMFLLCSVHFTPDHSSVFLLCSFSDVPYHNWVAAPFHSVHALFILCSAIPYLCCCIIPLSSCSVPLFFLGCIIQYQGCCTIPHCPFSCSPSCCCTVALYILGCTIPFHHTVLVIHSIVSLLYSFLAAPFRSCSVADPIHCALVVFLYSILGCTIPYLDCCSIPFCPSSVAARFPCVVAVSILGCTITLCSCCTIPFSTCSVPSCLHHYISGLLLHTIMFLLCSVHFTPDHSSVFLLCSFSDVPYHNWVAAPFHSVHALFILCSAIPYLCCCIIPLSSCSVPLFFLGLHRNCCLVSPYCIADPFHCVLALLHYSFLAAPFRSCPVADPIHCALVVFLYSILGCTIPYLDCCSIPFCPSSVAARFPCVVAVSILGCTIPFSPCSVPSCLHHSITVSPYCIADPFHCVLALLRYSFLVAPFRSCSVADPIHCALVVFLYSILGCTIPYLDCCSIPFCPSSVAARFPCVVAVSILGCTIPFSPCSVPSCLHHSISGLLHHSTLRLLLHSIKFLLGCPILSWLHHTITGLLHHTITGLLHHSIQSMLCSFFALPFHICVVASFH
ncbi:unnamed protein product [Acanthosepion pharaonis]|uniref:Uncharacterized protein n=1 Tax=Acanthosepion pharaonis TaxID=158019 RepID=A0A812BLJ6_ACAPH|nr:unnamed protein product [Sepia pharaonis]